MKTKRQIPPEKYSREYLLSDNLEGFQEFKERGLSYVKQLQLDMLALQQGTTLLEVGIGRGEFLYHCALKGARVTGIDYSPDALVVAKETLSEFPEADLRVADSRDLPFGDNSFQRVCSGDVLEHMDIEDGAVMLKEMYRTLQPGGFMLVHTAPNTVFTRGIYPLARPVLKLLYSETIRTLEEHMEVNRGVHVHEYNLLSLRKVARMAGLTKAEICIGQDILRSSKHRHTQVIGTNPLVGLLASLGKLSAVRFLFGNDLYWRCYK